MKRCRFKIQDSRFYFTQAHLQEVSIHIIHAIIAFVDSVFYVSNMWRNTILDGSKLIVVDNKSKGTYNSSVSTLEGIWHLLLQIPLHTLIFDKQHNMYKLHAHGYNGMHTETECKIKKQILRVAICYFRKNMYIIIRKS